MRNPVATVASIATVSGLLVFGLASPAAAATLTVCAVGCTTTTIQAAVDAAAPGDTITVAAGTYAEVVTINKAGLVLQGAQAGVDARGRSGASESVVTSGQFRLGADNITIDGFDFVAAASAPATPAAAIYGSGFSGTQIRNNIIEDSMFGAQFDNAGPAAARIENNVFRDNDVSYPVGGTGVFMLGPATGSNNVAIVNNDFSGHPNAAINLIGHDVLISGNTSTGDATLLVLTDSTDVEISGNTMTNATDGSGIFLGLGNDGVIVSGNILHSDAEPADNTAAIRISSAFGTGASENYTITGNQITGGWSHAIRRSVGAYDGVLAVRSNQFGMIVTNEETADEQAIDASSNWWNPAIDLDSMPNVITASPCVNTNCLPTPAAPLLPATGIDALVPLGLAGGALALGVLAFLGAVRRRARTTA